MKQKLLWITRTAVLLALLVTLQAVTKSLGQLVTGSCVNAILAIAALFSGLGSGIVIALVSPVLAFLLGIAPQFLTVPAIMAGNTAYVLLLALISGKSQGVVRTLIAWPVAAAAKFAVLYAIVVKVFCEGMAGDLMAAGMPVKMLDTLSATFSWPQLITALIGGAVALLMVPVLRKALKK